MARAGRLLTARDAAKILFGLPAPAPMHVRKVERWLECGKLKGTRHEGSACWMTTECQVAECLLRDAGLQEAARETPDAAAVATTALSRAQQSAARACRPAATTEHRRRPGEIFKSYLLALAGRQPAYGRSDGFQRAVNFGHAALLLLVVGVAVAGLRPLAAAAPPELSAVKRWVEENHPGQIQIRRCQPPQPAPDGNGVVMQVHYCYSMSGKKRIETSQWFTIAGEKVVRVDSEL